MTPRPRPVPAERLANPDAVLTRSDLRQLGYDRRAVDAIFKTAAARGGVIELPGYSWPLLRVSVFHEVLDHATYRNDRVRP